MLRWNYPGLTTVREVDHQLLQPNAVDPDVRQLNRDRGSLFEVIVESIVRKLSDQPCYVELSGGCDSSLVLSAATTACRNANHDPPVSITFRFPLLPEMDETHYQETILDYLKLQPGSIFQITDEFDLLGPSAQKGLKEFGPICPAPLFSHVDTLRSLEPGLLLSGEGGDEVLGPRRIAGLHRALGSLRSGNFRGAAGNLLNAVGTSHTRHDRIRKRTDGSKIDWIEPNEVARFLDENFRWSAEEPLRPSQYPAHYQQSQTAKFCFHQLTEVRRWTGQDFFAPLMDPTVVQAVADLTPAWKTRNRNEVLNYHFTDNLPTMILQRTSKAIFQPVYVNRYTKEFARSWSGQTNDSLVDGAKLKRYLMQEDVNKIHNLVFLLLQQAWLDEQGVTETLPPTS